MWILNTLQLQPFLTPHLMRFSKVIKCNLDRYIPNIQLSFILWAFIMLCVHYGETKMFLSNVMLVQINQGQRVMPVCSASLFRRISTDSSGEKCLYQTICWQTSAISDWCKVPASGLRWYDQKSSASQRSLHGKIFDRQQTAPSYHGGIHCFTSIDDAERSILVLAF